MTVLSFTGTALASKIISVRELTNEQHSIQFPRPDWRQDRYWRWRRVHIRRHVSHLFVSVSSLNRSATEPFEDEIHPRLRFAHRGLVAMANNGTKNSSDSQFFITLGASFFSAPRLRSDVASSRPS